MIHKVHTFSFEKDIRRFVSIRISRQVHQDDSIKSLIGANQIDFDLENKSKYSLLYGGVILYLTFTFAIVQRSFPSPTPVAVSKVKSPVYP